MCVSYMADIFKLIVDRLGNLPDLKAAGSLHEFLSNLHGRFGDLASFWFGELLCISVASSKLFKEVQVLFDRPRM